MKLIDILNLIAKGELEEGTQMIYRDVVFAYEKPTFKIEVGNEYAPVGFSLEDLNEEVELIEPIE